MNKNGSVRFQRSFFFLSSLGFLLKTATAVPAFAQAQPAATPPLILPQPQEIRLSGSATFTVGATTHISGPAESAAIPDDKHHLLAQSILVVEQIWRLGAPFHWGVS